MNAEMKARTEYFLSLGAMNDDELLHECEQIAARRADDLRKLHRVREVLEQRGLAVPA